MDKQTMIFLIKLFMDKMVLVLQDNCLHGDSLLLGILVRLQKPMLKKQLTKIKNRKPNG